MLLVPFGGERGDAIGGEAPRELLDLALVVGEVELVGHWRSCSPLPVMPDLIRHPESRM